MRVVGLNFQIGVDYPLLGLDYLVMKSPRTLPVKPHVKSLGYQKYTLLKFC